MIIEPLAYQLNAEDFSEAAADGHGRSPGLHLGRIIAALDEARGKRYPEKDAATTQNYFAIGFVWERIITGVFLETALKARAGNLIRPGEFHLDGIAMSPDAVDLEDYVLEEYKSTYLSAAKSIDDPAFWAWHIQMKAYCRAIGTRTARLRVWFIVGDWKGSGPQVRAWTFRFDEREIEENWAMIVNTARSKGWL